MAKKTISKIAAIALAGASAISSMSIAASAATVQNNKLYGYVYVVTTTNANSEEVIIRYASREAANEAGYTTYDIVDVTTLGSTVYLKDNIIYKTNVEGSTAYKTTAFGASSNTQHYIPASHRYSSANVYYSDETNTWYPNLESLKAATGSYTYTASKSSNYSSVNCWFDPEEGIYYSEALSSAFDTIYYIKPGSTSSTDSTSVYKVGTKYYHSYAAAYSAAGGNTSLIQWISDYTTLPARYFSSLTGKFYASYAAALEASNHNANYIVTVDSNNYVYDYYDYLYGYYDYNDPYYYYWFNTYYNNSTSKTKNSVELNSKKGWTSITNYLKKVSNGSTLTVDMNKETDVPSSVLSAIKGRNVTVKFVLDNGVTFTVNGKDVTSAKDVDLDTTYNTKNISNKLIKAAYKKNNAVSSAQLSIDAGSLGFTSDLTVKFNEKRSGYKAKLYRYNSSRNSLQLVDSATIGSNGKCTFDSVTKGGEFVIVIYK